MSSVVGANPASSFYASGVGVGVGVEDGDRARRLGWSRGGWMGADGMVAKEQATMVRMSEEVTDVAVRHVRWLAKFDPAVGE